MLTSAEPASATWLGRRLRALKGAAAIALLGLGAAAGRRCCALARGAPQSGGGGLPPPGATGASELSTSLGRECPTPFQTRPYGSTEASSLVPTGSSFAPTTSSRSAELVSRRQSSWFVVTSTPPCTELEAARSRSDREWIPARVDGRRPTTCATSLHCIDVPPTSLPRGHRTALVVARH